MDDQRPETEESLRENMHKEWEKIDVLKKATRGGRIQVIDVTSFFISTCSAAEVEHEELESWARRKLCDFLIPPGFANFATVIKKTAICDHDPSRIHHEIRMNAEAPRDGGR